MTRAEDIAAMQAEEDKKEETNFGATAELGSQPRVRPRLHPNLNDSIVSSTATSASSDTEALNRFPASALASFEIF